MSHRIEYQWAVLNVPASTALPAGRFIVAVEAGDNNVRDARTGRRARSWDACMIGTASQVLRQAVHFAGACEGGGLKPIGRDCSPESYIARIRRLLHEGRCVPPCAAWHPDVRLPADHAAIERAVQLGLPIDVESHYGLKRVRVDLAEHQHHLVFDFLDRFPDLRAWQLARVVGLPPF